MSIFPIRWGKIWILLTGTRSSIHTGFSLHHNHSLLLLISFVSLSRWKDIFSRYRISVQFFFLALTLDAILVFVATCFCWEIEHWSYCVYFKDHCNLKKQLAFLIVKWWPDIKVLIAEASTAKSSVWNKHIASYTTSERAKTPHPWSSLFRKPWLTSITDLLVMLLFLSHTLISALMFKFTNSEWTQKTLGTPPSTLKKAEPQVRALTLSLLVTLLCGHGHALWVINLVFSKFLDGCC